MCKKKVSGRSILREKEMDIDGSSREVTLKEKETRSLDQRLIKKCEAGWGVQDIRAKESNRLAPKSPHLLYRYLISQQHGTTVKAVRFDPSSASRPLAISKNRSIELGRQHGSLWSFPRMAERMNTLGTAIVTTWDLACGPCLAVTTHQDVISGPMSTWIVKSQIDCRPCY